VAGVISVAEEPAPTIVIMGLLWPQPQQAHDHDSSGGGRERDQPISVAPATPIG